MKSSLAQKNERRRRTKTWIAVSLLELRPGTALPFSFSPSIPPETCWRYVPQQMFPLVSTGVRYTVFISCIPHLCAHDPIMQFTGVIVSRVSWDIIIAKMFESSGVSGLTAVLESEGKSYTYSVHDGTAVFR
jgi:hypothetical protein